MKIPLRSTYFHLDIKKKELILTGYCAKKRCNCFIMKVKIKEIVKNGEEIYNEAKEKT